jgi:hypothetical protein
MYDIEKYEFNHERFPDPLSFIIADFYRLVPFCITPFTTAGGAVPGC